jgi:hypothetical protein
MIDFLPWDAEIESPATIAILGGGPLGIEAALYARFLGYHVSIFESRRVAHRMLDWNNRSLSLPASELTTSLGIAALRAQYPDVRDIDPGRMLTGKEYAEEYLLPLAKTDLVFDDIHFLSPVSDISRLRFRTEPDWASPEEYSWQERCNDEFRLVIRGRHRGVWTSRADCVIDCRGDSTESRGLGPGGGTAIGELEHAGDLYAYLPGDRKFDAKQAAGKRIVLVGGTAEACLGVREFLEFQNANPQTQFCWIVPPADSEDPEPLRLLRSELSMRASSDIVVIESLGVEKISKDDRGEWVLELLKDDDSTVVFRCDVLVRRTGNCTPPISPTLLVENPRANHWLGECVSSNKEDLHRLVQEVLTPEPGYFRLRAPSDPWVANNANASDDSTQVANVQLTCPTRGGTLPEAFARLQCIFAILGGRADLNLYEIMRKQQLNDAE